VLQSGNRDPISNAVTAGENRPSFDLMCCTLDFPEFRHWLMPVNVFAAPCKTLRLA
jgi:hypothetical protein